MCATVNQFRAHTAVQVAVYVGFEVDPKGTLFWGKTKGTLEPPKGIY